MGSNHQRKRRSRPNRKDAGSRGAGPKLSGLADFRKWMATAHGQHSPWGDEDSQLLVTVAEGALERQLSATIMRGGARPAVRRLAKGALIAEQGDPSNDIYLLLDGAMHNKMALLLALSRRYHIRKNLTTSRDGRI